MAFEANLKNMPALQAITDLSTKQYYLMKFTGDNQVDTCAATTDVPCGVLQNNPKGTSSKPLEAVVAYTGVTKVVAGGTITAGQRLGTDGNGKAVAYAEGTDTTKYCIGVALYGASSGDTFSMLLNPIPHRFA